MIDGYHSNPLTVRRHSQSTLTPPLQNASTRPNNKIQFTFENKLKIQNRIKLQNTISLFVNLYFEFVCKYLLVSGKSRQCFY